MQEIDGATLSVTPGQHVRTSLPLAKCMKVGSLKRMELGHAPHRTARRPQFAQRAIQNGVRVPSVRTLIRCLEHLPRRVHRAQTGTL